MKKVALLPSSSFLCGTTSSRAYNKLKIIFCILIAAPGLLKAQVAEYEQFQIYAPNTYALGQYGDVPVDLSNGLPQISIPLLSLSDKDINVNVSLSYHASGIKVDQEASVVGLGWALNAGGVITRQLSGNPDDSYHYNDRTAIPDVNADLSGEAYINQVKNLLYRAFHGITDNGPDVFYYNFCGRSGKFVLDKNGKAFFTPYEDFSVEMGAANYVNNFNSYFIITDDAGIKYEFRDIEYTQELATGSRSYVSAWYLSKITSPSGGEVIFSYINGGLVSGRYQARNHNVCYMPINENSTAPHQIPYDYRTTYYVQHSNISGIVLKKITTSSGHSIEFEFSATPRMDADWASGLNNQVNAVVLKDANSTPKKKFKFNYGYFETNNSRKLNNNDWQHLNYRLRLDEVQEISLDNEPLSLYKFDYFGDDNPTTDDVYTLPYRLSPSQDHWGYYNYSNNESIFPNNPADRPFHFDEWNTYFVPNNMGNTWVASFKVEGGGTREPNEEAMKAATLKKITYPTGGYTEFSFEAQYPDLTYYAPPAAAGGLRIKEIRTSDDNGNTTVKIYTYEPHYFDLEVCTYVNNKYYTVYHHNYNPDLNLDGAPEVLMGFGVPGHLANSNATILRIDAAPQVHLSSGRAAIYNRVIETTEGNGRVEYNYDYIGDQYQDLGGNNIDGIPTPGMFHSSYVCTDINACGGFGSPLHYSLSINACTQPFPELVNNDWRRGHLMLKEVFTEDGELVRQDSFKYEIKALHAVPDYKVIYLGGIGSGYQYIYARSYSVGGMAKIKEEITRLYNPNGVVRTVKKYDYTSPYHKHVTESTEYTSEGGPIITKYYYPADYGNYFSALKEKNIIAPIDIRTYKQNKLISGKQIEYNTNGLPKVIYNAEPLTSDISFNAENPFTFSPYVWRNYDTDNNLKMLKGRNGAQTSYLWGYDKTYPIAKIIHADTDYFMDFVAYTSFEGEDMKGGWSFTYTPGSNVSTTVGKTGKRSFTGGNIYKWDISMHIDYQLSFWARKSGSSSGSVTIDGSAKPISNSQWEYHSYILDISRDNIKVEVSGAYIDELRLHPVNAQMTTYTYDPLIGITSATNENGQPTSYKYDPFGRLETVKDSDDNILSDYKYHFKSQQ